MTIELLASFSDFNLISIKSNHEKSVVENSHSGGPSPLCVGAHRCDAQQEVHHDGADHHTEAKQDGPVLACLQGHLRPLLVQQLIPTELLIDASETDSRVQTMI